MTDVCECGWVRLAGWVAVVYFVSSRDWLIPSGTIPERPDCTALVLGNTRMVNGG